MQFFQVRTSDCHLPAELHIITPPDMEPHKQEFLPTIVPSLDSGELVIRVLFELWSGIIYMFLFFLTNTSFPPELNLAPDPSAISPSDLRNRIGTQMQRGFRPEIDHL